MRRPRIKWNVKESHRSPRPAPPDFGPSIIPEEYRDGLWVGSMWILTEPMYKDAYFDDARFVRREAPYLLRGTGSWNPSLVNIPAGSLAIYLGEVRVEESKGGAATMRRIRHAFFVGNARYLVLDLSVLRSAVAC